MPSFEFFKASFSWKLMTFLTIFKYLFLLDALLKIQSLCSQTHLKLSLLKFDAGSKYVGEHMWKQNTHTREALFSHFLSGVDFINFLFTQNDLLFLANDNWQMVNIFSQKAHNFRLQFDVEFLKYFLPNAMCWRH